MAPEGLFKNGHVIIYFYTYIHIYCIYNSYIRLSNISQKLAVKKAQRILSYTTIWPKKMIIIQIMIIISSSARCFAGNIGSRYIQKN